jgi:hypothetical protein
MGAGGELGGGCRRKTSLWEEGGERRGPRRVAGDRQPTGARGEKRGRPLARRRERWIGDEDDAIGDGGVDRFRFKILRVKL